MEWPTKLKLGMRASEINLATIYQRSNGPILAIHHHRRKTTQRNPTMPSYIPWTWPTTWPEACRPRYPCLPRLVPLLLTPGVPAVMFCTWSPICISPHVVISKPFPIWMVELAVPEVVERICSSVTCPFWFIRTHHITRPEIFVELHLVKHLMRT